MPATLIRYLGFFYLFLAAVTELNKCTRVSVRLSVSKMNFFLFGCRLQHICDFDLFDDSDSQSLALIIFSLKMVDYMFSLLLSAWRGSI